MWICERYDLRIRFNSIIYHLSTSLKSSCFLLVQFSRFLLSALEIVLNGKFPVIWQQLIIMTVAVDALSRKLSTMHVKINEIFCSNFRPCYECFISDNCTWFYVMYLPFLFFISFTATPKFALNFIKLINDYTWCSFQDINSSKLLNGPQRF